MPTFTPGVAKLGNVTKDIVVGVVRDFKALGGKVFRITAPAPGAVANGAATGASYLDKAAGGLAFALTPVRGFVNRFKVPTALAVTGGAAWMVKNHYDKKHDAALAQMQAQQQLSYMASTNPEEYALMMERMRGSQPGQPGQFQAAIEAERAAAAQATKQ